MTRLAASEAVEALAEQDPAMAALLPPGKAGVLMDLLRQLTDGIGDGTGDGLDEG